MCYLWVNNGNGMECIIWCEHFGGYKTIDRIPFSFTFILMPLLNVTIFMESRFASEFAIVNVKQV